MQNEKINMVHGERDKNEYFVGYCEAQLADSHCEVSFPMSVMYPVDQESKLEMIGPFPLDISINAQPAEGKFPLVLISHGSGGGNLLYRTLAHYLARNGFIVGMPEHPFNNFSNNTLEGTVENLENRPRHINIAIEWFFESENFARIIKPDAISIIGHSTGGCTALSMAGGIPTSLPSESLDGEPKEIIVAHKRKISSLVLLAPGTVWFQAKGALSEVDIPILMIAAEKDQFIQPYQAQTVLDGVADRSKVVYKIVENAGHFSFLSPFPEFMITPEFFPAQDPPGFDRQKYHDELNHEILNFLLAL
ncbi:MAG: alpha/beta hydrolase family protein [Bacillota bacterium]|jgi:predicted dienelactone hydrolase|nr:alpha/beta hydrolase family protein [Bacillota bacterium]